MLRKSFFVLAAVSSCCYAQQSAADVTTGLDSIAQSLSDITTLVKAVSTTEEARDMLNTYRDVIVAEGDFNNQERPATALTEDEQEQLCGSLKTAISQHISLLEAFSTQRAAIDSLYVPVAAELLRSDESSADYTNLKISELVPTCKETALERSGTLSDTFSDVMTQYNN